MVTDTQKDHVETEAERRAMLAQDKEQLEAPEGARAKEACTPRAFGGNGPVTPLISIYSLQN